MPPQSNKDQWSQYEVKGNENHLPDDWSKYEVPSQSASASPLHSTPQQSVVDRILAPRYMNTPAGDPNTLSGYGEHAAEALRGMGKGIEGLVTTPLPGMKGNPVIWNPATQLKKDWQGVREWNEIRQKNPDYAWGMFFGPELLTHVISGVAPHVLPAGMGDKLAAAAKVDPADVEPVANDLRAARGAVNPETGRVFGTPQTVDQFIDLAKSAQRKLDNEFSAELGKNSLVESNLPDVDGNTPLSKRILELKDKYSPENEWGRTARRAIDKKAAEYQHPISLGNLDLERKNANARIDAFEAAAQIKQASRRIANPDIAADEVVANWVRDNVYPEMDRLAGKPEGYFRQLKSRVGNLMKLQSDAEIQAENVRRAAAESRGTHLIDKLRPGISASSTGRPHAWLGNIKDAVIPVDREVSSDQAAADAFQLRRYIAPSKETRALIKAAKMPLSALVGSNTAEDQARRVADHLRSQYSAKGPKTQNLQKIADDARQSSQ